MPASPKAVAAPRPNCGNSRTDPLPAPRFPTISVVDRVEASCTAADWSFPRDHAAAVASHWQEETRRQPALFNGRILMLRDTVLANGALDARYVETDYAVMLYYMRSGAADGSVRNGFAMAAVTSCEGFLLLGKMAPHTANAGKVYCPGGTPDPNDLFGDRLDLEFSARRELREEAGLESPDIHLDSRWVLVEAPNRLAFMKPALSPLSATTLREKMLAHIRAEAEPELCDIVTVRSAGEIDPDTMPQFMQDYLRWWFAQGRAQFQPG